MVFEAFIFDIYSDVVKYNYSSCQKPLAAYIFGIIEVRLVVVVENPLCWKGLFDYLLGHLGRWLQSHGSKTGFSLQLEKLAPDFPAKLVGRGLHPKKSRPENQWLENQILLGNSSCLNSILSGAKLPVLGGWGSNHA